MFKCKLCKFTTSERRGIRNHLKEEHEKKSSKTRSIVKARWNFSDYYTRQ